MQVGTAYDHRGRKKHTAARTAPRRDFSADYDSRAALDLDNRVRHVRQQTQRRRGVLCDDDPKSRRRRVVPLPAPRVAPRVVMKILGYSQIGITMDVYTHVVQDTQREAMSHMDRLLRRRPARQ